MTNVVGFHKETSVRHGRTVYVYQASTSISRRGRSRNNNGVHTSIIRWLSTLNRRRSSISTQAKCSCGVIAAALSFTRPLCTSRYLTIQMCIETHLTAKSVRLAYFVTDLFHPIHIKQKQTQEWDSFMTWNSIEIFLKSSVKFSAYLILYQCDHPNICFKKAEGCLIPSGFLASQTPN